MIKSIKKYGLYVSFVKKLSNYGIINKSTEMIILEKRKAKRLNKNDLYKILQVDYNKMGLEDDVKNPVTFTGKINWLKINGDIKKKAKLADKYEVKKWVEKQVGEKYLIKTIGVWKGADDIDFGSLPKQFVFKANHGCGFNYIVRDKSKEDENEIKSVLQKWLNTSYGWSGLEIHYLHINRRILAEEYIAQIDGNLLDYKVHCFNGEPQFIQVIGDRDLVNHTGLQANYDFSWNRLSWVFEDYPAYPYDLQKPTQLNMIYEVSKKLCKGFPYVRVDLYLVNEGIKFGEMTFTPGNGNYPYKGTWTRKLDEQYGALIPIG